MNPQKLEMAGVREYGEGFPPWIEWDEGKERWTLNASNECGHNSTSIDLIDLLRWLKDNQDDLLREAFNKR